MNTNQFYWWFKVVKMWCIFKNSLQLTSVNWIEHGSFLYWFVCLGLLFPAMPWVHSKIPLDCVQYHLCNYRTCVILKRKLLWATEHILKLSLVYYKENIDRSGLQVPNVICKLFSNISGSKKFSWSWFLCMFTLILPVCIHVLLIAALISF